MNKLQKILSLCVEKGLSISIHSDLGNIHVYKLKNMKYLFDNSAYYNESNSLYGYESGTTIHIDKLIKKIEEYER